MASLSQPQRELLHQCVRAVSVQGGCGVKLSEVNNQTVSALLKKGLVEIETHRRYERVRPTEEGRHVIANA